MRRFRNILVGVDLAQSPNLSAAGLGADNREAIRQATWLARHNGGTVFFLAALNLSEDQLHRLAEEDRTRLTRTVEQTANESLDGLVREARAQGVESAAALVRGRGWVEIVRKVQRDGHDLVVVGARHSHGLRRVLYGSTARNLVRQCPCPVWVTKAAPVSDPPRVLVASDLSAVSEEALRLALALRDMTGARVDVLHAVEYPLDRLWSTGLADATTEAYHHDVQAEAWHQLQEQVRRAAGGESAEGVQLHLADKGALADSAILHFIHDHHVDLLVIGTIARGGLAGLMLGNTAERLLPEVPCSLLAVKPADFHSPSV